MKKVAIILILGILLLSTLPTDAGHGALTYGIITEPVPRIGLMTVETQDGYLVSAKTEPYKDSDDLYLGAQVTMRWDGSELFILHDSVQPKVTLEKHQWIGEITSYNPNLFSFFITSPAGDLRVFVSSSLSQTNDFACSSIIKITALKNPWSNHYIAEVIDVITR